MDDNSSWFNSYSGFIDVFPTLGAVKKKDRCNIIINSVDINSGGHGKLSQAGIPIIECLYLSRSTLSNSVMQDAIKISIKKMQAGAHLSESLKAANIFPKMILFMVATGEQSGRLGELMTQSVQHIDQQLDLIIDTMGKLIEPILLIFIGAIVAFLALSLYLPLFQSYSNAL